MKRKVTAISKETAQRLSQNSTMSTFSGELHGCPASVLSLDRVLPAGQAFRWRKLASNDTNKSPVWRGVIGKLIFDLSQFESTIRVLARSSLITNFNSPETDPIEMLKNYFNLQVDYCKLVGEWTEKDSNFMNCSLDTNGVRVLAVDPTEALFSFVCSSNNNIPRISKMVNNLVAFYGKRIGTVDGVDYHTFPKPADLIRDDVVSTLKNAGFGYRASFIVKAAQQVEQLGGEQWLMSLKDPSVPYSVATSKLLELHGVGRKVADCVSLIGLGKFEAVPIDTHVFQIAVKLYEIPCLIKSKKGTSTKKVAMSPKLYQEIGDFFRTLWGSHSGWAQQILFTQRVSKSPLF